MLRHIRAKQQKFQTSITQQLYDAVRWDPLYPTGRSKAAKFCFLTYFRPIISSWSQGILLKPIPQSVILSRETAYQMPIIVFRYKNKQTNRMSLQISSQKLIVHQQAEPNAEKKEPLTQSTSLTSSRQTERESSLAKAKTLTRKPDSRNSNLQSYMNNRRKSQQKMEQSNSTHRAEHPPTYPRPHQELIADCETPKESKAEGEAVKSKKKALTKEEILEIEHYVRGLQEENEDAVSLTGSVQLQQVGENKMKELCKKSKTEYFHFPQFQTQQLMELQSSQNLSQTSRIYIQSLKNKCKSVDDNNLLLQKRIKWLKEELEMHLERQTVFDNEKIALQAMVEEKDRVIKSQAKRYQHEKQKLYNEIQGKSVEIDNLKRMLAQLGNKFEDDKEILLAEMEYQRQQKDAQAEQRMTSSLQRISLLEEQIARLLQENRQLQFHAVNSCDVYNRSVAEKLLSENKYLRMENHMLARVKLDMETLKKENRRICNERDGLKKRIIESARRDAQRYRRYEEEDSEGASQFFSLSELSSASNMQPH